MSERVRVPDFQILRRVPANYADASYHCHYCGDAFGFNIPIYRDPLHDGEMTAHLSCAIEHGEVRVWTPEDMAAPWPAPEPCKHLLAFIEFYIDSSIVLANQDASAVGCFMCETALSGPEFSKLVLAAVAQGQDS